MKFNERFYDKLIGKRFGNLTYDCLMPRKKVGKKNVVMARFICDCGTVVIRRLNGVVQSKNPMCQTCAKRNRPRVGKNPLTGTWAGMMGRCYTKSNPSYKWYGAKGIAVCESWHKIKPFSEWALSHGWRRGCNIDRIDREGDYAPENCRIVSAKENQQNRSDNVMLTYNGETKCESEWERILGFPRGRIQGRRRIGMTGEALFQRGRYRNDGSRRCIEDGSHIQKVPLKQWLFALVEKTKGEIK